MTLYLSDLNRSPWRDLKYLWWFPVYVAIYLLCERLVTTEYWATQTPLDALIPFCEWFVIPYCLWYPLLIAVGLWLLVRDRGGFRQYMDFLALTFLGSAIVWLLVPNGQDLRPAFLADDNAFTRIVEFLYTADTNTNVFPSVHVVGAVGATLAIWKTPTLRNHRLVRWSVAILAVLICLSTVFIKQHAILDVAGGLALSLAVGLFVYEHNPLRWLRPLRHME